MSTVVSETFVNGAAVDGCLRDTVRSSNRNMPWLKMICETIDNPLEHSSDQVTVQYHFKTKARTLMIVDNGFGAHEVEQFLRPGVSYQTGNSSGNSTYGIGLFGCECILTNRNGRMRIATHPGDGQLRLVNRQIDRSENGSCCITPATPSTLADYGLNGTGTCIAFHGIQKRMPTKKQVEELSIKIGRVYSTGIASGRLRVELIRDGVVTVVHPEPIPACERLHCESIDVHGHRFEVEWGVTDSPSSDGGVRLVYGSKLFSTTMIPCGDYFVGRFFGQIRIPRSIGRESMDTYKNSVELEHPTIESAFDHASELFDDALSKSHTLCLKENDQSLTEAIANLLTRRKKKDCSKGDVGDGDAEVREFNGRDPNSEGVRPKHSNRKRNGKMGRKCPQKLNIEWSHLGDHDAMAKYIADGHRLLFNLDVDVVQKHNQAKNYEMLASIGAGHVAHAIESNESQRQFGFSDLSYSELFKELMARISS